MTACRPVDTMAVSSLNNLERDAEMCSNQLPPIVPKKYAGKWIAYDFAETNIIASGRSYDETLTAAKATGEARPVLVKTPDAKVRFMGGQLR